MEYTMRVPAKRFYQELMQSLAGDIEQATGKKIAPKTIHKGYTYKKKTQDGKEFTICVKEVETDHLYTSVSRSETEEITVTYELETLDDQHCRIRYRDHYHRLDGQPDSNWQVKLMDRISKRRLRKLFKRMEQHLLKGS
ncbi:DUF3284 domain-containing protein [Catenisphaera adipataccumulans]|uniref:DUF3284 domain-containing protein n=1 Tax=Catenisphaera adipataccumulans TaxID=700500 RepID=A0A7W8FW58_9FIRM|nr:DUF3284 domain-containing protein [Catenisphaera adipataccumulans]MBB5182350.1 hypothetical protein [Catenisphaera adipataccumulans]